MAPPQLVTSVKMPNEAYHSLAEKGECAANESSAKIFFQSFYAGCYIGFGALLAVVISGNMKGFTAENPGFESLVFAALFPVNLLLILLSGGILFTGTSAACPAALYEGRADIMNSLRCLALSWVGNLLGSMAFVVFAEGCDLIKGTTRATFVKIAVKKVSKGFGTTFLKGIGCNWMVCMAVILQGQAQDMCGKYLGIWFPISTFVMIGFEHIPANFYLLGSALVAGVVDDSLEVPTFVDVLWKNWIPVTLGNFVAGAFIVSGGYSYCFGRLGKPGLFQKPGGGAAQDPPDEKAGEVPPDMEASEMTEKKWERECSLGV